MRAIILWDMTPLKIFITRLIPDLGLILIKEHFQADIWSHEMPLSREELIERSRGVDGLLCTLTEKIDADLMDTIGAQLKVISSMSVGVDHIDIAAATAGNQGVDLVGARQCRAGGGGSVQLVREDGAVGRTGDGLAGTGRRQ